MEGLNNVDVCDSSGLVPKFLKPKPTCQKAGAKVTLVSDRKKRKATSNRSDSPSKEAAVPTGASSEPATAIQSSSCQRKNGVCFPSKKYWYGTVVQMI